MPYSFINLLLFTNLLAFVNGFVFNTNDVPASKYACSYYSDYDTVDYYHYEKTNFKETFPGLVEFYESIN